MKHQALTTATSDTNTNTRVVSTDLTAIFQNLVQAGLTSRQSATQLGLRLTWTQGKMLLSHHTG